MTDSPKKPGDASAPPSAGMVGNAGRRRLLQAGISTAPVVMTVLSRPVLGATCDSPSGYTSANASHPGMATCLGLTPSQWASLSTWPSGNPPLNRNGTSIHQVFGVNDNTKLLDVLNEPEISARPQIVAAYLNVRDSRIPPTVLTVAQVQHMWIEFAATNTYSPAPGAHWSAAELVDYLRTTQTQ